MTNRESLLAPVGEPLNRNLDACGYCGSQEHIIQKCELFEFHHDMGSEVSSEWSAGRRMVLARRQAKHFGGIPELYLWPRTPEQDAIVHAYEAERKQRMKEVVLWGMKKFIGPVQLIP